MDHRLGMTEGRRKPPRSKEAGEEEAKAAK